MNGHFISFPTIFRRSPAVSAAYRRAVSAGSSVRARARAAPLFNAQLIPSSELGERKPAASPIRNTPSPPRQSLSLIHISEPTRPY